MLESDGTFELAITPDDAVVAVAVSVYLFAGVLVFALDVVQTEWAECLFVGGAFRLGEFMHGYCLRESFAGFVVDPKYRCLFA